VLQVEITEKKPSYIRNLQNLNKQSIWTLVFGMWLYGLSF